MEWMCLPSTRNALSRSSQAQPSVTSWMLDALLFAQLKYLSTSATRYGQSRILPMVQHLPHWCFTYLLTEEVSSSLKVAVSFSFIFFCPMAEQVYNRGDAGCIDRNWSRISVSLIQSSIQTVNRGYYYTMDDTLAYGDIVSLYCEETRGFVFSHESR